MDCDIQTYAARSIAATPVAELSGSAISLNHIVTGVSSHPRGVMPISGRFTGCSGDCQSLTVAVRTEALPATR